MMHRHDVRILPRTSSSTQGHDQASSDRVITARIEMKLLAHALTAPYEIHVDTLRGVVELSGFAGTTKVRDVALRLAQHVEGVQSVVDALDVRRTD